jgi:hypothetical protein
MGPPEAMDVVAGVEETKTTQPVLEEVRSEATPVCCVESLKDNPEVAFIPWRWSPN